MDITCALCGQVIPKEEAIERIMPDGQVINVCPDCKDREVNMVRCRECGEWVPEEFAKYDRHMSNYVCDSCYEDEGFETCDRCGAITNDCGDVYTGNRYFQSERWCEECIDEESFTCEHCGDHFSSTDLGEYDMDEGRFICSSCYDDHYARCNGCGCIVNMDYANYDDEEEEYYCDSCWDDHNADVILDYYYKPHPVFNKTEKDSDSELMLGVELEIDKGDDQKKCATELNLLTDKLYMKHDGSLSSKRIGIEIVTHPCTLTYHQEEFPWEDVIRIARKYDYLSHDARTCGLHVHVGRKEFGDDHATARAIALVDRLWPMISILSRRNGDDQWAHRPNAYEAANEEQFTEARAEENIYRREISQGRYQAVNVTNSNTIEYRFNRGTLNYNTLIATLQMIYVISMYAKTKTLTECFKANWDDVMGDYKFPELRKYTTERLEANTPAAEDKECPRFITEEEYQNMISHKMGNNMHEANDEAMEALRRLIRRNESGELAGEDSELRFGTRVYVARDSRPYSLSDSDTGYILGQQYDVNVFFPNSNHVGHEGNGITRALCNAYGLNLTDDGYSGNWYVAPENLTVAPNPEPRVGDIVMYNHVSGEEMDSGNYRTDLIGNIGRVCDLSRRGTRGLIGVEWVNTLGYESNRDKCGHTCNGNCENRHGWYVRNSSLINLSR